MGSSRLDKLVLPPWDIAVPSADTRLRTRGVANTVYERPLPAGAFVNLGDGISISGPELVFAELAASLKPVELLMLGHELCGSFSRDAVDSFNGPVLYDVKPLTSAERIRHFLGELRYAHGLEKARAIAALLDDNAWSPMESLVAALLRLPLDDLGYEMGPLVLNPRQAKSCQLPGAKDSRVPDIMVAGTSIGLNYDGLVHLDLDSIVRAALDMGLNPGVSATQAALDEAVRSVREKATDDIRRNRELSSGGLSVLPVIKEDLYTSGGLDMLVGQLVAMLEKQGRDMSRTKRALGGKMLCRERQKLILSLLPGRYERDVQLARFIEGHEVVRGKFSIHECWVDL